LFEILAIFFCAVLKLIENKFPNKSYFDEIKKPVKEIKNTRI
jgi:hypothetical protein